MAIVTLEMEFSLKCSPSVLFKMLTTATGLSEWFADSVEVKDNIYTFNWGNDSESAEQVEIEQDEFVVYKWLDRNEDYFEFSIERNKVTNETILTIYDNLDELDKDDAENLWETQVNQLKYRLGA